MIQMYCLFLDPKISMEFAWEQLEHAGLEMAYSDEDEAGIKIFVFNASPEMFEGFDWITHFEPCVLPEIDWKAQWEMHGLDFKDGYVNLDLNQYGREVKPLKLEPGPGFGDVSHPTTQLVLELMAEYLVDQTVVDIGCGSGVLSLAAMAMGASQVCGIDISPEALIHSRNNAEINGLKCQFYFPHELELPIQSDHWLLVMNMIMSEQAVAWKSMPALHLLKGYMLTSGVRCEERELYLTQVKKYGWEWQKEIEKDGWLAFCFKL